MTSESTYEQDQSRWGTVTASGRGRGYISKPGDTLEALAEFFYGHYTHVAILKRDNPEWTDYHGGAALPSGTRLRVPDPNAPPEEAAPAAETAPAAAEETATPVEAAVAEEAPPAEEAAPVADVAPAEEAPAATEESAPAVREYTVVAGDSLSAIAQREYGDAGQWPRIFEANRDQIANPDLIHPGQVLRIPA